MSIVPAQWAVKQHIEKDPRCEWVCLHTKLKNLGEELPEMQVYGPSIVPSYIIESDGDSWFCHDSNFINLVESDEVVFAPTPQEALSDFIKLYAPKETK